MQTIYIAGIIILVVLIVILYISWSKKKEGAVVRTMGGMFLRIEKPKNGKYGSQFNFAEVQAFTADGANIALRKNTSQSSDFDINNKSYLGVNGENKNYVMNVGTENLGWWEVNFGKRYDITRIVLINRQDKFRDKMIGSSISLLDENRNEVKQWIITSALPVYTFLV
jgi:hypothetical protein